MYNCYVLTKWNDYTVYNKKGERVCNSVVETVRMCRHEIIKNGWWGRNKWPWWLPHWPGSSPGAGLPIG